MCGQLVCLDTVPSGSAAAQCGTMIMTARAAVGFRAAGPPSRHRESQPATSRYTTVAKCWPACVLRGKLEGFREKGVRQTLQHAARAAVCSRVSKHDLEMVGCGGGVVQQVLHLEAPWLCSALVDSI